MKTKKTYTSPTLEVQIIEFEQCIAVGSATVIPVDSSTAVQDEWETELNDTRTINW